MPLLNSLGSKLGVDGIARISPLRTSSRTAAALCSWASRSPSCEFLQVQIDGEIDVVAGLAFDAGQLADRRGPAALTSTWLVPARPRIARS